MPATYPTNPPGNTLAAIQQKVRRLTRTPSESQLSEDELNNYINTFVMYDFPEHLRTFQLRKPFTFWCNPYQDTYQLDIASFGGAPNASDNALYNFQNLYLAIHTPVYVAGYQTFYTQDRQEFFASYPINNFIQSIGVTGDGVTNQFTGVIQFGGTINNALNNASLSLLKRQVLFSSIDINGNGLSMVDVPYIDAITGAETIWGALYVAGTEPSISPQIVAPYALGPVNPPDVFSGNYINYVTGAFTVTFPQAPIAGQAINSQTVPTIPSRPFGMLFYNNTITLRPVPDQPYAINFEVDARPTQLFQTNSVPQLEELWQYISYGAALKIFQDRMDTESADAIRPEFDQQERMCLRRTLVQLTNQRSGTIYSRTTNDTNQFNQGWGFGGTF